MPGKEGASRAPVKRQVRLLQSVLPRVSLERALVVPRALEEQFAGDPTDPLSVAQAVEHSPQSSAWRYLTGAAEAYGLTSGAYNAKQIALTDLGRQVAAPTEEGADAEGLRQAALRPTALQKFFEKYDGKQFPRDEIAKNVLVAECSVPKERAALALEQVRETAHLVGFLVEIKGKSYVRLNGSRGSSQGDLDGDGQKDVELAERDVEVVDKRLEKPLATPAPVGGNQQFARANRVFISHGRNRAVVDQLKEIVRFGKLEPVVSVEKESPSIPVPEKVMTDMRSCFAGVIHVSSDEEIVGSDGKPRHKINDNVLIEIGAAMALYGSNFVLLVEKGLSLPSNLQGLYRCDYEGDALDGAATMKLLKAFNKFTA